MVVGFCKLKLALVAANALEARSRANPMTRPLETVANFIAAPFSFPKSRRKTVGAARLATAARKHLCSPTNRLKCWRRGCASQATSLRCREGGFLTWAAKPSVRESPNPAKILLLILSQHHLCAGSRLFYSLRSYCAQSSIGARHPPTFYWTQR